MHSSGGGIKTNQWLCINPASFLGDAHLEIILISQKPREATKYSPLF